MNSTDKPRKTDSTATRKTTTQSSSDPKPSFSRRDFFRDLKKVAKKQDRLSRPDSETR